MKEFDWNSDDVLSIVTGGAKSSGEVQAEAEKPADTAAVQAEPAAETFFPAENAAETYFPAEDAAEQTAFPAELPETPDTVGPIQEAVSSEETESPLSEALFGSDSGDEGGEIPPEDVPNREPYQPDYADRQPSIAEPIAEAQPVRPATVHEQPVRQVREKRSGGFGKKIVALALVCALLGSLVGAGGFYLATRLFGGSSARSATLQQSAPRETVPIQTVTVKSSQQMTAAEVYEKYVNSTVGITTEITTNYWGYQTTGAAAGSGFILTENGYILTNEHVIEDANTITVAMYDGTTYPATVVGYDTSNDIAVLKIEASGLTPVVLGDSDALKVGEQVVAIGNPLGELTFSLTGGWVSALNRSVTLSNATMNLIQTDCAINSGNSGGALFNLYGEVVGITNAKYSSSGYSSEASIDNIGFAIPINSVREIVKSIIEKGYISKPYIGVGVANVSEESQRFGLPKGAAITSVEEDSPAAKAGLQANDIITAVNGKEITTYQELSEIISASEVGDELELTVYRQNETLTIKVTIGEKIQSAIPESSQSSDQGSSGGSGSNPWGGSGGNGSDPFGWGWSWGG